MSNFSMGDLGNVASTLSNLFGRSGHSVQDYQDFAQRTGALGGQPDPSVANPQEVQDRYQHLMNTLPTGLMEQAHVQAVEQMTPQQRQDLIQQLMQAQQVQGGQAQGGMQRQQAVPNTAPQGGLMGLNPLQLVQNPNMLAQVLTRMLQQNPNLLGQSGQMLNNPMVQMVLTSVITMAMQQLASQVMQHPGLTGGAMPQFPAPQMGGGQPVQGGSFMPQGGGQSGLDLGQIVQGLSQFLGK